VTLFGLVIGALIAGLIIFAVMCLFIVGARGDDDQQKKNPEAEDRTKEIEPPARPGRQKNLH
jgi:hypothetical protein